MPGDHRPEPVLHVARPRQRDAVHPHDADGVARQVAAVLRQLLRPARLRLHPRRRRSAPAYSTGCPLHGGPGDIAGLKAVDRLAQRPHRRATTAATARRRSSRRLAQRQDRDDRQVLRRHVRQRRRRDGRRGPEDDRPDLGDLRLVRLLAHGRHPRTTPTTRRSLSNTITPNTARDRRLGVVPPDRNRLRARRATAMSAVGQRRRRRGRRHQRVLARPRLQPGRRQGQGRRLRVARPQRRQRPPGPLRAVVGRPRRRTTSRASCGSRTRATSTRSTTAAPSGSTRCTAGSTLAPGRAERHHGRAAGRHRDGAEHVWKTTPTGRSRHEADRRLPARHGRRRAGHARRCARAATTDTLDVHGREPDREQRDQHADGLAGEPARVPLAAAQARPAHLRHADRSTSRRR